MHKRQLEGVLSGCIWCILSKITVIIMMMMMIRMKKEEWEGKKRKKKEKTNTIMVPPNPSGNSKSRSGCSGSIGRWHLLSDFLCVPDPPKHST